MGSDQDPCPWPLSLGARKVERRVAFEEPVRHQSEAGLARRVVWVVGAQKVVPDLDAAFGRIERYSLPLEDARLRETYGMPSYVGKQLVVSREQPGRITVLLVESQLGF